MKTIFQSNPDINISLTVLIISLFGFAACHKPLTLEEKVEIENRASNNCSSKASGSSPRCWSETDWDAYCSHVQCK